MATENIKVTTWFDRLPTEIIFETFDYLSNNDIIYTFFYFSQRLNNLILQNQRYLHYLELPTKDLNTWENLLQIISLQIECLIIKTIDLSFPLSCFPNLKSIIISFQYGFPYEELKLIIESEQFKNLHSLKIKENIVFPDTSQTSFVIDEHYVLKKIFSAENLLHTFQCPSSFAQTYGLTFETNYYLKSLTLILADFQDVFTLISYTPNLKYLNIQVELPYKHHEPMIQTNVELKQLHLKCYWNRQISNAFFDTENDFGRLISDIKQFSSSLVSLSLNLVGSGMKTSDAFPIDSIKLQQFLELMIELKQFHLYTKLRENSYVTDNILSKYKDRFWSDHNWSFGMHGNYFYTLPFRFDHLCQSFKSFDEVTSNNSEMININPRTWYNVRNIDLPIAMKYDLDFIKELKMKMPKLTTIKFTDFDPCHSDKIENVNKRGQICLDSVTSVHLTNGSLESGSDWLIYALPNLKHLVLSYGKLPSTKSELAPILDKQIEQLDISMIGELEQLTNKNYLYFSNVENINLGFNFYYMPNSRWYANIAMKLMRNFKDLKTLMIYIVEASKYCSIPVVEKEFSKLIEYLDLDEILQNYQVKCFRTYYLFSKRTYDS